MNKKIIISAIATSILMPFFASAQGATTTVTVQSPVAIVATLSTTTPNQLFTACNQVAIEKRDTAIASAKTTYNNTMTAALTARKDAEKAAVALTDTATMKTATKAAVDAYRSQAKSAQDTLKKTRGDIWTAFDTDSKACRDAKKASTAQVTAAKKVEQGERTAEHKAEMEKKNAEHKMEMEARKASSTQAKVEKKKEVEKRREAIKSDTEAKIEAVRKNASSTVNH